MNVCIIVSDYKSFRLLPSATVRQGNIFTGVCQSFCSGGGVVYISMHWAGGVSHHALGRGCVSQHTLGGGVSQDALRQTPPRRPLQRAVRILLECILVCLKFCSFRVTRHKNALTHDMDQTDLAKIA